MPSMVHFPRRIHIAPVGFEIDRVVIPVIEMRADKVWLMAERDPARDQGGPYLERVESEIRRQNEHCEIEIKRCDFDSRDLYDVLRAFREIVDEERENHIFVNVSTGTKIHAIAGMMACMIFKDHAAALIPYYAKPDTYLPLPEEANQMSMGCRVIHQLPNYRIERPSEDLIRMLTVINECCGNESENVTKHELIRKLRERGLLTVSEDEDRTIRNEKVAYYLALQRKCIEPLRKWNFIKIEPQTRRGKIQMTQEGRDMLKFLD
jgi:hypothetical protein